MAPKKAILTNAPSDRLASAQPIENLLAMELLAGKFLDGDTIRVDADQHGFAFEKVNKS